MERAVNLRVTERPRARRRTGIRAALATSLGLAAVGALAPPTAAEMSSGIVTDQEGRLYFADDLHETVWRVDPAGGPLEAFVKGVRSLRLALDEGGNLYGEDIRYDRVEDKWTSRLWKADAKGHVKNLYGPKPGFPPGLLMDAEGNRYWNVRSVAPEPNSRIVKQTPSGEVSSVAGGKWGLRDGQGEKVLMGPVYDMVWGPDHRIYFTDNNTIRYLTLDGWVTTVTRFPIAEPTPDLPEPTTLWGLTVDQEGTSHVAIYAQRRVDRVLRTGGKQIVMQSKAPWFPTGVTTVGRKVYILEHGLVPPNTRLGPRVLEFLPQGVLRVVARVDSTGVAN